MFPVAFKEIFIIPVPKENKMINPALVIYTGVPSVVAWQIIQTPPAVAFKIIKILSM